jgi:hypothetical protein
MVKRQMATAAGFVAPEYFWLVSREKQDDDAAFYSKVTRNNWSDL